MIYDLDQLDAAPQHAQIAIIGGGAVGITMAVALARRGVRVLLCESGGRRIEASAQALNNAVLSGRQHLGIIEGRARVLGGTTTLWGGQLVSFREIDFRARPWLGLDAWPITRATLTPYYEAVAAMLGLAEGVDDDEVVWNKIGLCQPHLGVNVEVLLTRWLKEPNLARGFLGDIEGQPTLTTLLHATATDFNLAADGRTIVSATLRSGRGRQVTIEADHFVIATGTIEASRLMLAAARAKPELPWSTNEWVGASFQDHLDLRAAEVELIDKQRFSDAFDNVVVKGHKYNPKVALSPHIQLDRQLTNVAGAFVFESSLTNHLSNIKIFIKALRNGAVPPNLRSLPSHMTALFKVWWPLIMRYLRDHRVFNPADLGVVLRLHCEQVPLRNSRIRLHPHHVDANGMPLAELDWRVDGREIEAIAVCCDELDRALADAGLARLRIDPRILARDPAILETARDTNHHCGGLRMSADPAAGVVDPHLRVHGTTNLYVAGAAVFPSSSFANPTYTGMALGLRLCDRLAEQPNG